MERMQRESEVGTRVTCIRHGETARNISGVFSGMGTEEITDEARGRLSAAGLDPAGFDAIYSSPAVRCLATTAALGIDDFRIDARLAERDFGIFEGLEAAECQRRFPELFVEFKRLTEDFAIPEGESRAQHLHRILDWLEDAVAYENVLAITHGGTIDFLYRLGAGVAPHGGSKVFAGRNGAKSIFDVEWPRVTLVTHSTDL